MDHHPEQFDQCDGHAESGERCSLEAEHRGLHSFDRLDEDDEQARLEAALSCGPQCASSVLAVRYAKILRQERLLRDAAKLLERYQNAVAETAVISDIGRFLVLVGEGGGLRQEINDEEGNPA